MNLKEKQKEEAIKRMERLNLNKNIIKEFMEEEKLNLSETQGLLYWLNDEQQKMVNDFEDESNGIAYHLVHNKTEFGELYSIFFVSKHLEEWQYDWEDFNNDISFVYVRNIDNENFSEYGSVGFKKVNSGLVRTT